MHSWKLRMTDRRKTYIVPQMKALCFAPLRETEALLSESLPLHEEEEAPHVTDDSQVFAKPRSVWDEE